MSFLLATSSVSSRNTNSPFLGVRYPGQKIPCIAHLRHDGRISSHCSLIVSEVAYLTKPYRSSTSRKTRIGAKKCKKNHPTLILRRRQASHPAERVGIALGTHSMDGRIFVRDMLQTSHWRRKTQKTNKSAVPISFLI